MKTLKLSAGMPAGVKFITRDALNKEVAEAWGSKPEIDYRGVWQSEAGPSICWVFIGDALKPGEIAKVVK